MGMKSAWYRRTWGASLALAWMLPLSAAAAAAEVAVESPAAASAWSGTGLWVGIGAVVLLGAVVLGRMLRSGGKAQPAPRQGDPAGDPDAVTPRGYSEKNVGNDASARPWERSGPGVDIGTAAGSQGGVIIEVPSNFGPVRDVPAGFDVEGFLVASKSNFVALQEAWDRSDIGSLRAMMTDGMLDQIRLQLAEREQGSPGASVALTEVLMLDAHLLGIEELDEAYLASVEFSGMLREEPAGAAEPFRELWTITRPKAGAGGWLVAGVQSLQ
jgi:predicted lipid-binding transport protein (Tim44 family)